MSSAFLLCLGLLLVPFSGCIDDSEQVSEPWHDPLAKAYGLSTVPASQEPGVGEWLLASTNATEDGTLFTFDTTIPEGAYSEDPFPATHVEVVVLAEPGNESRLDLWGLHHFAEGSEMEGAEGAILPIGPGSSTLYEVDAKAPDVVLETYPPRIEPRTSMFLTVEPGPVRLTLVVRATESIPAGALFRFIEPSSNASANREEALATIDGPVGLVASASVAQGYRMGLYGPMVDPDGRSIQARTPDVAITRTDEETSTGVRVRFVLDAALDVEVGWGSVQFEGGGSSPTSTIAWSGNGTLHGTPVPNGGRGQMVLGLADDTYRAPTSFDLHAAGEGPTRIHIEYEIEGPQAGGDIRWLHVDVGAPKTALL